MLFKKDELRILWPFYLFALVLGLFYVIIPFFIIYFRNLGFSFFQISVILGAFGVGSFLFEVPTGAFADGFSRKVSTVIGFFITGVAAMFITFFPSFYIAALMWFFAGIGQSFISGAEESWVVDNLKYYNRNDLSQEFFIKNYSFASVGMIFAPFIGAFLVKAYSLSILWVVTGAGFILSGLILAIFAKEMYKPEKSSMIDSLKKTWGKSKEGLKFCLSHKTVLLLILGSIFTAMLLFGENGWQPFLVSLSLPQYALGFVYSIVAIGWVLCPFVPKLFGKVNVKKAAITVIIIRMLLLFSVLLIRPPFYLFAATIMILDQSFKAMSDPLLQDYIHRFVPSNIRATVISIKSMSVQLIPLALAGLIAGVLQDALGPQKVIALGGLFGVFAIATYLKIKD